MDGQDEPHMNILLQPQTGRGWVDIDVQLHKQDL